MSATPQAAAATNPMPAPTWPVHITPDGAMRELADLRRRLEEAAKRLSAFTEDDLAIATST